MLYSFFKSPIYIFKQNNSFKQSLKELFSVFCYATLFLFINYLLVSIIDLIIRSTVGFSFMEAINGAQKTASNQNNALYFLLLAPIAEELIFRLPLKISRVNIFISAVMAYFLFYLSHKPISSLITANELIKVTAFISLIILVLSILKERILSFVQHQYFGVYFYAMITVFGLLHVTNFLSAIPGNLIVLAPLFAFHQVIVGFFLGYLRLKNGLIWCILLHSLFNLLPTISYFINK